MRSKSIALSLAAAMAIGFSLHPTVAGAEVLRASHQFPGGKGDARDEMVQIIAREVAKAKVGLEIQVYPGASLFKPNDQWNAMVKGQLDISSFPLDYASGRVPQFGATLMPALVRSHERAARLDKSPFMADIRKIIEKNGVIVLSDAWLAGAFGAKDRCILTPADAKGLKLRAAGPTFAEMWAGAGASITATPSNEVYNALQTGVIDATDTSTGSFVSFRLYEQIKCVTAPGDNALWFMYEPVLMSKMKFDRLTPDQKKALIAAGKKAEEYFRGAAKTLDDKMVAAFKEANDKVVTMTPAQFDAWLDLAKRTSYKEFAAKVEGGQKLIDEALAVK
ncbi:MAG TPA: TRAP transporter substrate-binding protein DctP [Stellaceae bacterium]|nr:TRAP transporter substrate-binding protein DctP [Stellaceae bacterium]